MAQAMALSVVRPPRLVVHPELADDDVTWLNRQLELVDHPAVRYARALPSPPPPLSTGLLLPLERIR